MGLLQSDDRVKSIVKTERANYRKMKYEYNKKRHFMGATSSGTDQYKEEEQVRDSLDMLNRAIFTAIHSINFVLLWLDIRLHPLVC